MQTLITIQDKMIADMLASTPETGQWATAFERGVKAIEGIGFTHKQAWAAAYDAHDMARLEIEAR